MVSNLVASFLIVMRNTSRLVVAPYATMREISKSWDPYQVGIIWGFVYIYFLFSSIVRSGSLSPGIFLRNSGTSFWFFAMTLSLAILYFFLFEKLIKLPEEGRGGSKSKYLPQLQKYFMLFSYSLLPTWIWFTMTSLLYVVWPPPRYPTLLGKTFTLIFIAISITLLLWRVVLWYLSLRFTYKTPFYAIFLAMVLFATWFIPYVVYMYQQSIFRVPFI